MLGGKYKVLGMMGRGSNGVTYRVTAAALSDMKHQGCVPEYMGAALMFVTGQTGLLTSGSLHIFTLCSFSCAAFTGGGA